MLPKDTLDRIIQLGHEPAIEIAGDRPFALTPSGFQVMELSAYFPPKVIRQNVAVETPSSFVQYVNRFKTDDTMIFADVSDTGAKIMAVLDYHGPPDKAARGCHTVLYATVATSEWKTWMDADRKPVNQLAFATWLEDNIALFNHPDASPTGAELLELVLSLEGKQHVNFNSALRLDSGKNRLEFDEDVMLKGTTQAGTKPGSIELPRELLAAIAPFMGSVPYSVRARLKYRIQSRQLSLWFETIAPHVIIRDSVRSVLETIEAGTALKAVLGKIIT